MANTKILRIRIDYTDGSYDSITPIQEDPMLLYGLERNGTAEKDSSNGAYTHGAIAALLFITVIFNQYKEYKVLDPNIVKILNCWFEKPLEK